MPLGFNAPTILFLATWEKQEQQYLNALFRKVRAAGYHRYVEPCAGAFAMQFVARDVGYTMAQMEGSDVGLFSAVCGFMCAGRDLAELDVRLEGRPVPLDGSITHQAATLLYTQWLARLEAKRAVDYWLEMRRDVIENREWHVAKIEEKCSAMAARLSGMTYEPLDLFDHIEQVRDDPTAVVSLNPPSYKAGFEKFYDTKERLTWAEPRYDIFDPVDGQARLRKVLDGAACLGVVGQDYCETRRCAHERPIYARPLSAGRTIYFWSNRPDEVMAHTKGRPVVVPRRVGDIVPLDIPLIPVGHDITAQSKIALLRITRENAAYYKTLWLHRIQSSTMGSDFAVLIDGYLAAVATLSGDAIGRPVRLGTETSDCMILVSGLGAPHDRLRLGRLVTSICLQRGTTDWLFGPTSFYPSLATGVVSTNFTRHPEAKEMRGLMKLAFKEKHADGWRLVYRAPMGEMSTAGALAAWLKSEAHWRKSSKKGKTGG